jgi:hypothetical protein
MNSSISGVTTCPENHKIISQKQTKKAAALDNFELRPTPNY